MSILNTIFRRIIFLLLLIITTSSAYAQVVINEIVASNASGLFDSDNSNYSDWIELYNAGASSVDISGYFLTDNVLTPTQWEIPAGTTIDAGAYLLFWADALGVTNHTSFKLSKDGEFLALYDVSGTEVDVITFPAQTTDVSYGREVDATTWAFFTSPTPEDINSTSTNLGVAPKPTFSLPGGFYANEQEVSITTGLAGGTVYYTTDGTEPTVLSAEASGSITLSELSVVRAAVFHDDYQKSPIVARTYFIAAGQSDLPVVSITTDPDNLWDNQIGIYVTGTNGIDGNGFEDNPQNFNQDWERPINMEYYRKNGGNMAFDMTGTIKISGGWSRAKSQKSFTVSCAQSGDNSKINYKIFDAKPIAEFDDLHFRNSGNDWEHTMFRDALTQYLVKDKMDIDYQAYSPVVVYLNGEYWGIHNIREKLNEDYFKSNENRYGEDFDYLENHYDVKEGDELAFDSLFSFIENNDLSDQANFDYVASRVDVEEYLNYMIAEIYCNNTDWPHNNLRYWRSRTTDSKWRWIYYDTDFGFGYAKSFDYNALAWAMSSMGTNDQLWSTAMFRSMMDNEAYKNEFIQRFAAHIGITWSANRVTNMINEMASAIDAEMASHIDRWKSDCYETQWGSYICYLRSKTSWYDKVAIMIDFGERRGSIIRGDLQPKFGLGTSLPMTFEVSSANAGSIAVMGVETEEASTDIRLYSEVPLRLEAVAKPGYIFTGWTGLFTEVLDSIVIDLTEEGTITANFEEIPMDNSIVDLYINEVQAQNDTGLEDEHGESNDWIELYNSGTAAIDVGGLYISDDINLMMKWRIPSTDATVTTIAAGDYLILWADNDTTQGVLHLGFALDNDGENIILSADGSSIVDLFTYGPQTPDYSVGRSPDGSTILVDFPIPTPAATNIGLVGLEDERDIDLLVYPNPTSGVVRVIAALPLEASMISLYSTTGEKIPVLTQTIDDLVQIEVATIQQGLYILKVVIEDHVYIIKLLKQ